ncbi:XPG domain containing-domain-containing protein [Xylariaceae sp. FL0016]|nr:XPG domain containing-domain-containing protein [Xylariaceae sp. FL0016]
MGIRGLSTALSRYGLFSSLSGDTVVIDGPALVHRIFEACMKLRTYDTGFACQYPSYSFLGLMIVGWLDELHSYNVKIRKIYFDGYLPPSKWSVRKQRLLEQSNKMKTLMTSNPRGSKRSSENAFTHLNAERALTLSLVHTGHSSLPKAPFLIPAAIEALRHSHVWGPLVEVVPGEADAYCAEDVRLNGGVVLTSDSDLLIQDLGPGGSVAFFEDVVPNHPTDREFGISAKKVSCHDINAQLGISNVGGLPRVAFEMIRLRSTFQQAVERVKNQNLTTSHTPQYQAFVDEYDTRGFLGGDHPALGILSTLDPRISEVLVQTLLMKDGGGVPQDTEVATSRGPETLAMFPPIMVEDRNRKSSWTMSTSVREIAYGLLQDLAPARSIHIIEYRLLELSGAQAGRQIGIDNHDQVISRCVLLLEAMNTVHSAIPLSELRWFAFAVYQDFEMSSSDSTTPLSAELITRAMRNTEDASIHQWDLIHFTAQFHSCLYSFRMLKQALDIIILMGRCPPMPVQQLRTQLAAIPPIAEWPTIEDMHSLLVRFGQAKGRKIISELLSLPDYEQAEPLEASTSLHKQKKQTPGRSSGRASTKGPRRSPSINPFALLSQAGQD